MALPELSNDLWLRVTSFLDARSLHALSQVSRAFHELATDRNNFRRFIPDTEHEKTDPAVSYRRVRALESAPEEYRSVGLSSDIRILCTAHDSLVLLDVPKYRLIALPSGVTVSVLQLLGLSESSLVRDDLSKRHIVLPDQCIGVVGGYRPTGLTTWNVKTGDVASLKLNGVKKTYGRSARRKLINGKLAAVAGNNGEYLMYYTDDNTFYLRNWRDGKFDCLYTNISDDVIYLMGECPAVCGQSVVGFMLHPVISDEQRFLKDVKVVGFDDVERMIRVDDDFTCHSALRSIDTNTTVLIGAISRGWSKAVINVSLNNGNIYPFRVATRKYLMPHPELRENGQLVSARCDPLLYNRNRRVVRNESILWLVPNPDDTYDETSSTAIRHKDRTPPIWSLRTGDTGYVVTLRPRDGVIDLVKIVKEKKESKETRLKRWSIKERIVDACVVSNHFIAATCEHGRLYVWHFDHFCQDYDGSYRCQGLLPEDLGAVACSDGN